MKKEPCGQCHGWGCFGCGGSGMVEVAEVSKSPVGSFNISNPFIVCDCSRIHVLEQKENRISCPCGASFGVDLTDDGIEFYGGGGMSGGSGGGIGVSGSGSTSPEGKIDKY